MLAFAAITMLLALASSARAQVVTFGADLNRPVNYRFDCGAAPGVGAFGEQILYPTNVGTCTWIATGRNFGQLENALVPSGVGTVTNVRIKQGPITGPMQVVVLRAIRYDAVVGTPPGGAGVNVVCCAEIGRSAVFTPAANAISTVAVNLPVKADIVPNPITNAFDFDVLGLSVLAPGVPVPVHDTGNYQDISGPSAAIYFPAIRPGQERADTFGTIGYQLLLQADWVAARGGTPGGATVTLVQPVATTERRFLLLGLRCNAATPCVGALRIQNQGAATRVSAAKRPRVVTVAKGEFEIPAGQAAQVKAKLTPKGKRLLRRSDRPALYANLRIGGAESTAGAISVSP